MPDTTTPPPESSEIRGASHEVAERKLFYAQIGLVSAMAVLLLVGYVIESRSDDERSFGTFWFGFLIGTMGASIALTRRMKDSPSVADAIARSRISLLMPLLYGGLMASVAYLLFMSGVLSGDDGGGLITTNLFPNFGVKGQATPPPSVTTYLAFRPTSLTDAGKLLVWCFIAGYSETFVKKLLAQLESSGSRD